MFADQPVLTTAFGLDISLSRPVAGLPLQAEPSRHITRRIDVSLDRTRAEVGELFGSVVGASAGGPEVVVEEAPAGHLLQWRDFCGCFVGREGYVAGWQRDGPGARAQADRFLVAQVLPFAATVMGLEVMHASAVSVGGGVVALAGPSGVGKSTTAGALVALGARLVADDVLALESVGDEILGYPGPPVLRLVPADGHAATDASGKAVTLQEGDPAPSALRTLFLLRRGDARVTSIVPLSEARALLGVTFNASIEDAGRMMRHLELCSSIAWRGAAWTVNMGATDAPEAVARRLLAHLGYDLVE